MYDSIDMTSQASAWMEWDGMAAQRPIESNEMFVWTMENDWKLFQKCIDI